jgi:outer membrane protein
LVASNKLQQKAQDRTAVATEQDVLLATDEAFYRLLDAQSLLQVAKATVASRNNVRDLTAALTKSALKSDLELNIAAADLSQSQLPQLDAENAVASASAALAALCCSFDTVYQAVEDAVRHPTLFRQRSSVEFGSAGTGPTFKRNSTHRPTEVRPRATTSILTMALDRRFPLHRTESSCQVVWSRGRKSSILFTGFRITAQAEVKSGDRRRRAGTKSSNTIARDVRTQC